MPKVVAERDGFELYAWVTTAYLLTETAALSLTLDQSFLVGSMSSSFAKYSQDIARIKSLATP